MNKNEFKSEIDLSLLEPVIKEKAKDEGALISILQAAQETYGYLPEEVLRYISEKTRVPLSRVYGVVTFYAQLYLTPRGKYTIRACRGTACHVRGAQRVIKTVKSTLDIEEDETTPDMKFTFETVACFGACALAPVMMVGRNYYGHMNPKKVETVLKSFE
jgi:NADH:ubiquinone oxidoreductase subunit E